MADDADTVSAADWSNAPDTVSADDWNKPSDTITADDWNSAPGETIGAPSAIGSALRRGALELPVGGAAGLGMIGGGAAGALTSPVTGPVGPFVGAVGGGIGAGHLAQRGEDWVLHALGLDQGTGFFSKSQRMADELANPKTSFGAELAGNALPSFGVGAGRAVGQRAIGALIQGGMEAGQEAYQGEDLDPAKIGIAGAVGGLLSRPRGWVNRVGAKLQRQPGTDFTLQGEPYDPNGPNDIEEAEPDQPNRDVKQLPSGALEGDVLSPAQKSAQENIDLATQERDKHPEGGAMWTYWDNYIRDLDETPSNGANVEIDASQGPQSRQNLFTVRDADRANDITTYARGIAAENPPAPLVMGAGNPIGAPMDSRVAARPSEALRDYRKDRPQLPAPTQTQQSTVISTDPIHADVAAALTTDQPQSTFAQQTVRTPPPGQPDNGITGNTAVPPTAQQTPAPPLNPPQPRGAPALNAVVARAVQRATQRPIVRTPIPEGMNSSKYPNGPIYADPSIPDHLVRGGVVHETVEQDLMNAGVGADQAHQIATQAEKSAVERMGMPWEPYQHQWDGKLAHTEQQAQNEPPQPADKHVSTDVSLGDNNRGAAQVGGVTAAVTPRDQQIIDAATKALTDANMQTALGRLKALPPQDQARAATQLLYALQSKTGEAIGTEGVVRMPEKRQSVEGAGTMARSKADAARKSGAIKAWDAAVAAYGDADKEGPIPTTKEDRAALVARLQQMVKHAGDAVGNIDPTKAYRPNVKPASYLRLKAAMKVIKSPTPKNVTDYLAVARMGAEGAKDVQQTNRIEGDIGRKPQIEDAAADTMIEKGAADRSTDRIVHEDFDNSNGDESAVYTRQQNSMRDWLNGLSDEDHATILKKNPDMELDMQSTQDPAELMRNYMDDLAESQGKRPGVIEAVPAEDVKGKAQRVTTRADVDRFAPTEEGAAASTGKSLKNDPRFAELAAQYATAGAKPRGLSLESLEAPEQTEARTVPGSVQSLFDTIKDFAGNEEGSLKLQNIQNWWNNQRQSAFSPAAASPIRDYADQLGGWFTRMTGRMSRNTADLIANLHRTPKVTPAEAGQVYRAMEDGTTRALPADLKDWHDSYIKPVMDKYGPAYDELRTIMKKYQLPGWDKLPARSASQGNGFTEFVPRISMKDATPDDGNDVFMGKTLAAWAPTTQERNYFTLVGTNGQRLVYTPGDGYITILRNGAPTKLAFKSNTFDPTQIGSTINMKVKGKPDTFTVTHSKIDEITAATRGTERYYDNPAFVTTMAVNGLQNALERARQYRDIVESPDFQTMTATNKDAADALAKKLGVRMIQPDLPQFKKTYMPDRWAWIMNDYHQRGIPFTGAEAEKQKIDALSGMAAKTFLAFGPQIHDLNVANQWAVGRGFKWITPSGWGKLVQTAPQAIKAAHTLDPSIYKEIIEAGGNPMYAHAFARDAATQMARATGVDIAKNPSMWDKLGKVWGMNIPELSKAAYDLSTAKMWKVSDMFYIQRYLEARSQGMSPEEAVQDTEKFIPNYQMGPTVGGSRLAKQVLSDPSVSYFAPYHYNIFRTFGNMAKDLVGIQSTPKQRMDAAGQIMAMVAMGYMVYPALSKAYQNLTGSQNSEFEPRGMNRVVKTAEEVATGKKDLSSSLRDVWTPGVPATMGMEAFQNKNWKGDKIVPQQPLNSARHVGQDVGRVADWALGNAVSPYQTISNALSGNRGMSGAGRTFLENLANIKTKTPQGAKYEQNLPIQQRKDEIKRERHPGGIMEEIANRLGGR